MVMSKYLLISWGKTQQAEDFDFLLKLFAANRDACELMHESKWSMLVRYENGCLDEMAFHKTIDGQTFDSLEQLLKETEADSLDDLKADLDHSDDLIDVGVNADDDDEFEKNLVNLL